MQSPGFQRQPAMRATRQQHAASPVVGLQRRGANSTSAPGACRATNDDHIINPEKTEFPPPVLLRTEALFAEQVVESIVFDFNNNASNLVDRTSLHYSKLDFILQDNTNKFVHHIIQHNHQSTLSNQVFSTNAYIFIATINSGGLAPDRTQYASKEVKVVS